MLRATMAALTFTHLQMQALSQSLAQQRADALAGGVDAVLAERGTATTAAPEARLQALCALTLAPLAGNPAAAALSVDVAHAAMLLQHALDAGAPYRETHAAAMLAAAAALGALWFIDPRLLRGDEGLSNTEADADTVRQLADPALGGRFETASARALRLAPRLQHALREAAADDWSPAALRLIADAAWDDGSDPGWLERFVGRERRLIDAADITDGRLTALCIAGDLAFGLGRCVRLLGRAPAGHDAAALADHLQGALHGLVRRAVG